jgi:hypothetical protein
MWVHMVQSARNEWKVLLKGLYIVAGSIVSFETWASLLRMFPEYL